MIDRFRFPEVLCSCLSPVATGQVTSLSQLPEIFPDQARIVAEYCSCCGETELANLFAPNCDALSSSPSSLLHIGSCGGALPALYHARRLYFQQNDRDSAAKVLLEVADTLRKQETSLHGDAHTACDCLAVEDFHIQIQLATTNTFALEWRCLSSYSLFPHSGGLFLDFINLGLTTWEADVVFSDMRRRGENRLLYACLIARAQYKEAQDLLAEVDSDIVSQMSRHSTHKLSRTPVVCALSSTINHCLPHLQYLLPFSTLINPIHSNEQGTSSTDANSTEENVNNEVHLECVEMDSTHASPASSTGQLPRRFATPKGRRLSIQPSTADRNQASEFWNYYDVAQRVLRGEKPFEAQSPVKPRITDSARRLSRKLRQADTSENASLRSGTDFWTELSKLREVELSKPTNVSAAPAASILKMPSEPSRECTKTPSPTYKATEADISFQDCHEATSSLEVDEDDVEVTINPHTLQLGHKVSITGTMAEQSVISESVPVISSSSTKFTFSPPNRTVISRSGQMDEVAQALCSATHFAFASPATYLMNKFLSSTSGVASPIGEVGKECGPLETSYGVTSTSGVEDISAYEPQDEAIEDLREDAEDAGDGTESAATGDVRSDAAEAVVATDEDETSTHPGTEEDERSEASLQPSRRSRRKVKKPERYHY
ncbi:unnamed protein product [Hydatigera taeniaeformis]|uniref:Uncharacterized protein n=1 Tax=Hydatigena taeniaeformis TaxID=6205 RepID=A0A3P7EHG2_HYDTA|nr:unnamed protein product [Hydatigera taeniaeformis]